MGDHEPTVTAHEKDVAEEILRTNRNKDLENQRRLGQEKRIGVLHELRESNLETLLKDLQKGDIIVYLETPLKHNEGFKAAREMIKQERNLIKRVLKQVFFEMKARHNPLPHYATWSAENINRSKFFPFLHATIISDKLPGQEFETLTARGFFSPKVRLEKNAESLQHLPYRNFVVLRPQGSDGQIEAFINFVKAQKDAPYDMLSGAKMQINGFFNTNLSSKENGKFHCQELVATGLKAADLLDLPAERSTSTLTVLDMLKYGKVKIAHSFLHSYMQGKLRELDEKN